MARAASQQNRIWFQQDKSFRVIAERRTDRAGSFRVRFWYVGNRFEYVSTDSEEESIQTAQRIWADYLRTNGNAALKNPETIKQLAESYIQRPNLRPKTKEFYRTNLMEFVSFVGDRRRYSRITRRDIEAYLDNLKCSEVSKKSKLRAIKCMFNFAIKNGILDSSPAISLIIQVKTKMRPYLNPKEIEPFLIHCTDSHRIRAGFTLESGCRVGELVNLKWDSVFLDVDKPFVIFEANKETGFEPKWGKRGAVPLSKTALHYLTMARVKWPHSNYVFSNKFVRVTGNLRRATNQACVGAGVTVIDFHGLRRSAAIRWLMNGVPIHVVSQLLRHSSIDTTVKHYGWLMTNELARHIEGF